MTHTKRTIRTLKKELKLIDKRLEGYKKMDDDLTYITVNRLSASRNTIEWILRMLEEGDFS